MNETLGLYPRTCKTCGKKFESKKEYAWKCRQETYSTKTHYFCSYGCMREYEKKVEKKVEQKRIGPTKRQEEFLELLNSGLGVVEIARRLGVTERRVRTVRDEWDIG